MVNESFLPVGVSGEKLDTTTVTQTDGKTTHREAVVITDPEDLDARVSIKQIDGVYYLPVTDTQMFSYQQGIQEEILQNILGELKVMNHHLAIMSDDTEISIEDLHGDEL